MGPIGEAIRLKLFPSVPTPQLGSKWEQCGMGIEFTNLRTPKLKIRPNNRFFLGPFVRYFFLLLTANVD